MDKDELKEALLDTMDRIQEVKNKISELIELKRELQYLQLWQTEQLERLNY